MSAVLTADFFDTVRTTAFKGKLTQGQVDGLTRIVAYGRGIKASRPDLAYTLASAHHETNGWMQPIREGASRFGTNYTDAQSRRAVKSLFDKGIIRTNYALPDAGGNSFYGRGLIQITWRENYAKFETICNLPLVSNPDLALTWEAALPIMFIGMRDGLFRNKSWADIPDLMKKPEFTAAMRGIVNGDQSKHGLTIATLAGHYWHALETAYD